VTGVAGRSGVSYGIATLIGRWYRKAVIDIAKVRNDDFFNNPLPDWEEQLKGPAERLKWMKKRYDRDQH